MESNIKMKLNKLLEERHKREVGKEPPKLEEVYGIIYRIYCIPEDKSYIGQTLSHGYINDKLSRKGIVTRLRNHYNNKSLEINKDKPLNIALSKYDAEQFEVFEEEKIVGKELALINQKEGGYMSKYNSMVPNGYNTEEIGKIYSKILIDLSELHSFEIKKYEYVDTTRDRRRKDISIGKYLNLGRDPIGIERTIELLKKVELDNIYLTDSNGLRIVARVKNDNVNIRVYFKGTPNECLEQAKEISDNIIISSTFYGKGSCYKYQNKLDAVLTDKDKITAVTGTDYNNNSRDHKTYLIIVYGNKNNRHQQLHRISFGGKTVPIEESYKIAIDFIDRLKENIGEKVSITYKIKDPFV